MSDGRSVSSQVEVAVDPRAAFRIFTEEIDLWWVRGPINFYDASRAVAMRCEPGVGGRLLEVYDASNDASNDASSDDALELARITVWEPGVRLAWRSSVDDVETEVHFEPAATGTLVRVVATIPEGGADRGGTAWVRVVPPWFGAWCARRERRGSEPREPRDLARLAVAVYYARPVAAARWLAEAFGFEPTNPLPHEDGDGAPSWIEFHVGNCSLLIFRLEAAEAEADAADASPPAGPIVPMTHIPWVFVDDLEAHFEHAKACGATIVEAITRHGFKAYVADDPEGRRWTLAQARPSMV